jgi:hypothetical protein
MVEFPILGQFIQSETVTLNGPPLVDSEIDVSQTWIPSLKKKGRATRRP